MATHQVQAPDGTVYDIEAPDGTSDDDLIAFALDHHEQQNQPTLAQGLTATPKQVPMHEGMTHKTFDKTPQNLDPVSARMYRMSQEPGKVLQEGIEGNLGSPQERHNAFLMATGKPYDPTMEAGYKKKIEDLGMNVGGMAGVIKPVGGQWLEGVDRALSKLKKPILNNEGIHPDLVAGREEFNKNPTALNKWIDGNLRKYVLNRMATPEDEVRKLADEGVHHIDLGTAEQGVNSVSMRDREAMGFPEEGVAKTEAGKRWENAADRHIRPYKAGDTNAQMSVFPINDKDKWLNKLSQENPSADVYRVKTDADMHRTLGFDHIIDVLGEKLASGELRPEQLSKVSMSDAVKMTHDYNVAAAKKMEDAQKALKTTHEIHKEYPDGFYWAKLTKPGQFAAESDIMGHSVRGYEPPSKGARTDQRGLDTENWMSESHPDVEIGSSEYWRLSDLHAKNLKDGSHPDWIKESGDMGSEDYGHGGWEAIKSGKAEVYSLRDPKGQSHATVEVGPREQGLTWDEAAQRYEEEKGEPANDPSILDDWGIDNDILIGDEYANKDTNKTISQIKGKQNKKPDAKYIPYILDFVQAGHPKHGPWSDVGDLENTDLIFKDGKYQPK